MSQQSEIYYVYVYTDPLTNEPIYVGKGKGHRAKWHASQRAAYSVKSHLINRIKKIRRLGAEPIISFLVQNVDEEFAHLLEQEAISKYGRRDLGFGPLLNGTDGGEGSSGISETNRAIKIETCKRLFKDKPKSREHREKISAAAKQQDLSTQVSAMQQANIGKKRPQEVLEKIRQSLIGKMRSDETKTKQSQRQLNHPKLTCEHCGGVFRPAAIGRYHGDRCKSKK
jgi:hypothetical protein